MRPQARILPESVTTSISRSSRVQVLTVPNRNSKHRTHRVSGFGTAREAAEQELESRNIVLPFPQRGEWQEAIGERTSTLVMTSDSDGQTRAAAGIGIGRSRALPWHCIYRVERLASTRSEAADAALLRAITDAARSDPFCIRLHLGIFERDAETRQRLGAMLRELGFVKSEQPEAYRRTPSLELERSEEELFGRLATSARRNVRAPAKRGFQLISLENVSYAGRMQELMDESFRRTGQTALRLPWETILRRSERSPNRSRVIGLFPPNDTTPASLLAFAWGCVNGNYVTYEAGGSTRKDELGNLPLAYAPLWDLIAWAKRIGATWFDFGGVSTTDAPSGDDPLAGVSDFKRFFCERVVEVRDEWILEPRPIRAMLARTVSDAAQRVRR
jgi:FemAB family